MNIVEKIKHIIEKNFNTINNFSIEFVTEENLHKNSEILNIFEYPAFNYLSILYHNEYYLKNYGAKDLSVNIFVNKKFVGFWFLSLINNNDDYELISIDENIKEPLLIKTLEKKIKTKIILIAINILNEIINNNLIKKITCSNTPCLETNKVNLWQRNLILSKFVPKFSYRQYINLENDVNVIRSNFNSTRRNYLNKTLTDNYKLIIINYKNFNSDQFEEFKNLHFLKSQRKTRSDKTWEIQKDMIKNNKACIVGYKRNRELISGIFNYYSKKVAIYSVAVFDNDNNYLSTKLMYENILYLKKNKISYFLLNELKFFEEDKKKININFFLSKISDDIFHYCTFEKNN